MIEIQLTVTNRVGDKQAEQTNSGERVVIFKKSNDEFRTNAAATWDTRWAGHTHTYIETEGKEERGRNRGREGEGKRESE